MRTNKAEYINTHGRTPKGRGFWMIEMVGTDGEGRFTNYTGEAWGTLTEAKQTVARNFRKEVGGVKRIVEAIILP